LYETIDEKIFVDWFEGTVVIGGVESPKSAPAQSQN
jgi:hypothetical protein